MISTHDTLTRTLAKGMALAALLAALGVPTALGATKRSSYGAHDSWYKLAISGDVGKSNADAVPFITDTLAPGDVGKTNADAARFITDTLAPGGGTIAVVTADNGFSWLDAGIGAASTAGLMVILLAGTRLLTQRRRVIAV